MADTYKVKSDYTVLRRKARQTSKGDVYENNLMTITPFEVVMPEGQNIIYSDSNFKFSYRTDSNLKKRHSKSDWIRNASGETEWTLDDIIDAPISDESIIRIKPDYSSLRDFAYYGSAVEMVHATVNHVLMHFPGELYFSDDKFKPTNRQGEVIDIGNYYIVYNECDINIDSDYIDESKVDNPNRFLCLSIGNYELLKDGEFVRSGLTRGDFQRNKNFCDEGILGTVKVAGITITVYVMGGQKFYLHQNTTNKGISIRPNQDIITEYFETIDDFERVLLNRESNPIYKAVFETTTEKEDGYYYTMESYIWPSVNDWTPDMHSSAYQSYIMRLISLAEYHDEFDSNNMWRMMTHEAIKNLDWTFFRENGDDIEDLSNIDSSRIEAIIQLYGRQYDGLKRYIDNIKHSNKITYDQKNNIPDYLLTDTVENAGFDAILPNPTAKTSVETDESLFSGLSRGHNEVDANTFFMRNLKLNAPYLNSVKGTREGIEAMLGILGFCKDEYEIDEYVTVATGNTDYCIMDAWQIFGISGDSVERNISYKYPAAIDIEMVNQNKDSFPVNEFATSYQGIACKPVTVYDGDKTYRYVIPWYENGKYYDGDWYFQCDGGWGQQATINVSGMTILDQPLGISELSASTELSLFEETESRLKFAERLEEMLDIFPNNLVDGDICYVTDISNLKTFQNGVYSGISETILSHYFIINDKTNYCLLGESGWTYIPLSDITSSTPSIQAQKVIYLETIKENTTGNNPHVAKRNYDGGEKYVEYLDNIFKYNIETSGFSFFSDVDINNAISKYTFGIDKDYKLDNRKAEYFRREEQSSLTISGGTDREVDDFCSGYTIINPEGDDIHLEAAANSIINLKNIEIKFNKPQNIDDSDMRMKEWIHYLKTVVFNYVKQMLPSTCILRWIIGKEEKPQPIPTLTVSPTELIFDSGSSSQIITVTATNQDWTMANGNCYNWIMLEKKGTNKIEVTVQSNPSSADPRDCSFTVNGSISGSTTVSVHQKPAKSSAQVSGVVVTIIEVPTIPASGGIVTKSTEGVKYSAYTIYDDSTTAWTVDSVTSNIVRGDNLGSGVTEEQVVGTLSITAKTGTVTGTDAKDVKQEANTVDVTSDTTTKTEVSGDTTSTTIYQLDIQNPTINVSYERGQAQNKVLASATTEYTYNGWLITTATTTYTSAYTSGTKVTESDDDVTSVPSGGTWSETNAAQVSVQQKENWQTVTTGEDGYIRYNANDNYEPRTGNIVYVVNGTNETGMTQMIQEGKPVPPTRTIKIIPSTNWSFEVTGDELLNLDEVEFYLCCETASGDLDEVERKILSHGELHPNEQVQFENEGSIVITGATTDTFTIDLYLCDGRGERKIHVNAVDAPDRWMNGMDFTMTANGIFEGISSVTKTIPAGTDTYTWVLNNYNPLAEISQAR